jgi:hypothetical protein
MCQGDPKMNKAFFVYLGITLGFGICLLGMIPLWRGMPERSRIVIFVVPHGFRGVFVIEENPAAGVPPLVQGNVTTYTIPRSGKLLTTTIDPLTEWHSVEARYDDGTALPNEGNADRVALRGLWSVDRRVYTLVGTAKEAHDKWLSPNKAALKPSE